MLSTPLPDYRCFFPFSSITYTTEETTETTKERTIVTKKTSVIHQWCPHCKQNTIEQERCQKCPYKPLLQWCTYCKKNSVVCQSIHEQQCHICKFRPNLDCPKCKGKDCILGDNCEPHYCSQCDFREDWSHLHTPIGDNPTFTEQENEPENKKESYETHQMSKKQKKTHAIAHKITQTAEENRQEQLESNFTLILNKLAARLGYRCSDYQSACLNYFQSYLKMLKLESELGKKKYEPEKKKFSEEKQVVVRKYEQMGYKYSDFKEYKKDKYDENRNLTQLVKEKAAWDRYKLEMDKYNQEMAKVFDPDYAGPGLPDYPVEPPPKSAEFSEFSFWTDYRNDLYRIEKKLREIKTKIGRISDHVYNMEELAVVCLFLHSEQCSSLEKMNLQTFYSRSTGNLNQQVPAVVQETMDKLRTELKIPLPGFLNLVEQMVEQSKREITHKTNITFETGDCKRIQLQLGTILPEARDLQNQHEPRMVALAVILNALKEISIPGLIKKNRKWNAKFIQESLLMKNPTKINAAAKAMKHKIDILSNVVENK